MDILGIAGPKAVAQFNRIFGSQADKDDQIGKQAAFEAQRLTAAIQKDDKAAADVAQEFAGWLTDETAKQLIRAALRGDREEVLQIVLRDVDAAIQREAEREATEYVENLTPAALMP